MEKKWTAAQLAAIERQDKTLLVSAAAGSGKTATLTERIIRSITDKSSPADISKMLIVTFTRASAGDLKNKILSALNDALAKDPKNNHLVSQLIKLGSAKICTIDSFYLELLRSNFTELGLSPSFRIADTVEVEILAKSVMAEVIEYFYETREEFPLFAECFTGLRNSDALIDILLNLDSHLKSIPEGIEFLNRKAKETEKEADLDFFATSFGKVLRGHFKDAIEYYLEASTSACDYIASDEAFAKAYLPAFEHQRTFCIALLGAINNSESGYCEVRDLLLSNINVKLKPLKSELITPELDMFKKMRDDFNGKIKDFSNEAFSKAPEIISRAIKDTAKHTAMLYDVLLEFNTRLDDEKKKRNFLDFSDVRRYTLKLLLNEDKTPTSTAKKYADEFSHIYIDEYQDVDEVQDLIFSAISKPTNRFMVGDIKQSIYSFRGAEPKVFASYRSSFPDHNDAEADKSDCQTIFMSNNFRCDKNVIDFTNLVCSYIFSACTESIGYKKSDDLEFSKIGQPENYESPRVDVTIITLPRKDRSKEAEKIDTNDPLEDTDIFDTKECEARFIASEINRLIKHEKKSDGTSINPGDIAVLSRAKSMNAYIADALHEYGILTSESDSDKYFENPDVLMTLCILNAIDNPQRDIFLTGALRSSIFGFTMDDLIQVRKNCDPSHSLYDAVCVYAQDASPLAQKCASFIETLSEWRDNAAALPVDKFLQFLFNTDIFVASGLLAPSENGTCGNVLRLYEYARNFETGSFKGLYQFIEFTNTLIEEGKKLESPPMSISPDKVSLMSIHQSKGLEFPVCFVCGTASKFNQSDQKESLLFDYPLGVAMKIADSGGFARINTPMRDAIRQNVKIKQTEEEMRVLYVAMTRARERLYLTAATKRDKDSLLSAAELRSKLFGRHVIMECTSYLDWILMAALSSPDDPSYNLSFIDGGTIADSDKTESENMTSDGNEINEELYELLKEKFAFKYPYSDFARVPAKISVSKLSPDVLDEFDTSAKLIPDDKSAAVPDFFKTDKPSRASAAERGIATHLFLQFCNFERTKKNGVDEELSLLTEQRFIPPNTASLIFKDELEAFFKSTLIDEILNAKQVIREQRFNLLMPTSEFTKDKEFAERLKYEHLAVQGVIDLIVITQDGRICVYDYKTDRLTKEELASDKFAGEKLNKHHALQLSYYARAVEMIFERPCDELFIYSTHAAKLFEVKRVPLAVLDSIDTL